MSAFLCFFFQFSYSFHHFHSCLPVVSVSFHFFSSFVHLLGSPFCLVPPFYILPPAPLFCGWGWVYVLSTSFSLPAIPPFHTLTSLSRWVHVFLNLLMSSPLLTPLPACLLIFAYFLISWLIYLFSLLCYSSFFSFIIPSVSILSIFLSFSLSFHQCKCLSLSYFHYFHITCIFHISTSTVFLLPHTIFPFLLFILCSFSSSLLPAYYYVYLPSSFLL